MQALIHLLEAIHKSEVCKGNFEDKYISLPIICGGIFDEPVQ